MWAGGPPKPMHPIRPHSLAISPRFGRRVRGCTARTYPAARVDSLTGSEIRASTTARSLLHRPPNRDRPAIRSDNATPIRCSACLGIWTPWPPNSEGGQRRQGPLLRAHFLGERRSLLSAAACNSRSPRDLPASARSHSSGNLAGVGFPSNIAGPCLAGSAVCAASDQSGGGASTPTSIDLDRGGTEIF